MALKGLTYNSNLTIQISWSSLTHQYAYINLPVPKPSQEFLAPKPSYNYS